MTYNRRITKGKATGVVNFKMGRITRNRETAKNKSNKNGRFLREKPREGHEERAGGGQRLCLIPAVSKGQPLLVQHSQLAGQHHQSDLWQHQ